MSLAVELNQPFSYRPLGTGATLGLSLQNHASRDADAEHIDPALREIDQMGVEQRTDDVLHHDHLANPGGEAGLPPEQEEMHQPERPKYGSADDAELDR